MPSALILPRSVFFLCSSRCPPNISQETVATIAGEERLWFLTYRLLNSPSLNEQRILTFHFISSANSLSPELIAQRVVTGANASSSIVVLTFPRVGVDEAIDKLIEGSEIEVLVAVVDPSLLGEHSSDFAAISGRRSIHVQPCVHLMGYLVKFAVYIGGGTNLAVFRSDPQLKSVPRSFEEVILDDVVSDDCLDNISQLGGGAWDERNFSTYDFRNTTNDTNCRARRIPMLSFSAVLLQSVSSADHFFKSVHTDIPKTALLISTNLALGYPENGMPSAVDLDISFHVPSMLRSIVEGSDSAAAQCIIQVSSSCARNGTFDGSYKTALFTGNVESDLFRKLSSNLLQIPSHKSSPSVPIVSVQEFQTKGDTNFEITNPTAAMSEEAGGVFIVSYDVVPTVQFVDLDTRVIMLVTTSPARGVIWRYTSVAHLAGRVFVFGGQNDGGTLYSNLYSAAVSRETLTFTLVSPANGVSPPPRCSASLTSVSPSRLYLYGGQCSTRVPCNDLWSFDIESSIWTRLSLSGGPPTGRYFHSALYFKHDFTSPSGVVDTDWIVFAGGRYTTPVFSMYIYGINSGRWSFIQSIAPAALLPCLGFANGMVVVTTGRLGSVGANSTFSTFDTNVNRWGSYTIDSLEPGPQVCVTTASNERGFTSLLLRTAKTARAFQQLMFYTEDCSRVREQNMVLSADGQTCEPCEEGTTAELSGRSCVSCNALESGMDRWQLPKCYSSKDESKVYAAIAIALVIQLLVVPAIWAVTRVIHASSVAAKNQRAATELSEAVSQMMFERVGYLESIEHPTKIERALSSCVRHMKTYHSFFPAAVAVIVDKAIAELKRKELGRCATTGDASTDSDDDESTRMWQRRALEERKVQLPSGSATTRVMAALSCGLVVREVSVVVTYITGLPETPGNPRKVAVKLTKLLDSLIQLIRLNSGVPDIVLGDHIFSSWNACAPVANHQAIALHAAYQIAHSPLFASHRIPLRCGVASCAGRVGILGTEQFRRHIVGTPASREAKLYAHLCAKFDVNVMCEWTPLIRDVLSDRFVFRILGEVRVARAPPQVDSVNSPGIQGTPINSAVGPRWERALFAEVLGSLTLPQWVYELRGHRELVDIYNTIIRAIFLGKLSEARQLSIPKEMPKWYEVQLRQAISAGELPVIIVDPFV